MAGPTPKQRDRMMGYLNESGYQDTSGFQDEIEHLMNKERLDDDELNGLDSPKLFSYKSVKGDQVDELIGELMNNRNLRIPFLRMKQGQYLIGTMCCQVIIKNNNCMVRVGGGFEPLHSFLEAKEPTEVEKLKLAMKKESKSLRQVVKDLLIKYKVERSMVGPLLK